MRFNQSKQSDDASGPDSLVLSNDTQGADFRQQSPIAAADTSIYARSSARDIRIIGQSAFAHTWVGLRKAYQEEADYGHLFLLYPVALGVGAAIWFVGKTQPDRGVLFACLSFAALAIWTARSSPLTGYLLRLLAVGVIGALLADFETNRSSTIILDGPVTTVISGRVISLETIGSRRQRYLLAVDSTRDPELRRPPERIYLTARGVEGAKIETGDNIEVRARLSPPSGPAAPGLHDFGFGAFFEKTGAYGYTLGTPKRLSKTPNAKIDPLDRSIQLVNRVRNAIAQSIYAALPGDTGAFAAAIIVNERRGLSQDTADALRASGLAHVIAISGLHMALASGLFFWAIRAGFSFFPAFAQSHPVKKYAAAAALAAATIYLILSGAPVSARRAYVMLAIMLLAVLNDRGAFNLRNVAIAAIIIICLTPSAVLGPGFQMSFAATIALIAGYQLWRKRSAAKSIRPMREIPRMLRQFMSGILLTSLIGGLATAPIALAHFYTVSAYGLAANLLAMPVFSLIVMPLALISVLAMPFGLEYPFLKVMGAGLDLTMAIAHRFADLGSAWYLGKPPQWFLPLAALALIGLCLPRTNLRWIGGILALALPIALLGMSDSTKPDIIVAEDGRLVGLLEKGRVYISMYRGGRFTIEQWQRAYGLKEVDYAQRAADAPIDKSHGTSAKFMCNENGFCEARHQSGLRIATIGQASLVGQACDNADIIILKSWSKLKKCRSGAQIIDLSTLKQRGSIAIHIQSHSQNVTSKKPMWTMQGALDNADRAWNQHRYYDWRTGRFSAPYHSTSDNAG